MPTIEILGVPHAYDMLGPLNSSETLVFVHGWLLSGHYWQPLAELLSSDRRCLWYDLRGFGESQPCKQESSQDHANYSLAAYAKDLGLLLKQLNISSAWLVGHSLGGSIALWGRINYRSKSRGYLSEFWWRYLFEGRV